MKVRSAIVFIIATLVTPGAGAQGSWRSHTDAGEYAFAQGVLGRAEAEFRAALEIAQKFPAGDSRLETSLENLARLYEHESDFDRAQPLYQLLLAAKEARLGPDDPALLNTLYAVARVSQPMGDLLTVVDSLQRFAAIAEASGKGNPRQHWQALQMLARMETVRENPDDALGWQRRAAVVIVGDPSATTPERIDLLMSLAEMELVAGNGPKAEGVYDEVAELRAKGNEAYAFPDTMAQGAETALAAADFETAERLATRALNGSPDAGSELRARKVLAELSWITVNRGTDDMTTLLAASGDNDDLVRARDRLQSLIVQEAGNDRITLARLARVEALRGQPAAAASWQRRLLDAVADDPEAAAAARRDLVTLLAAAGRWDEALAENASVLAELETEYGPSDRRLLPALSQRLELLERAHRRKEAKKVRKRMNTLSR